MLLSSFVGLAEASDETVFRYAQRWGLLTVCRDKDERIRDVLWMRELLCSNTATDWQTP
jgi:predicted nuclease of predicted toxin-antitoxin system